MTHDNFFPSSSFDINAKDSTMSDYQSALHGSHSMVVFPSKTEEKLSSPYMTLSVGDNRYFGESASRTLALTTSDFGHEKGDRIHPPNETKSNEPRKHGIEKQKSNLRSNSSRKKSMKTKEKRKRNSNKRKKTTKRINRKNIRQRRYQRKQTSRKQSVASKTKVARKTSKRKSSRLSQRTRNLSSPHLASQQSVISKPMEWFSLILPETDAAVQNQFRQRLQQYSTFRPELRSSNESVIHMTNGPPNLKPNYNSLGRTLPQSKGKERKSKQQARGRTKLNIRSPIHATPKKRKKIRRNQKRLRSNRARKLFRCTPNTLITIARSGGSNKTIGTKCSFTKRRSLSSTAMPLTKHIAQLTSKNNNRCIDSNKRLGSDSKLKSSKL